MAGLAMSDTRSEAPLRPRAAERRILIVDPDATGPPPRSAASR